MKRFFLLTTLLLMSISGAFADLVSDIYIHHSKYWFPARWNSYTHLYTYVDLDADAAGYMDGQIFYTNSGSVSIRPRYTKSGSAKTSANYGIAVNGSAEFSSAQNFNLAELGLLSVHSRLYVHTTVVTWHKRETKTKDVEIVYDNSGPSFVPHFEPLSEDERAVVFFDGMNLNYTVSVDGILLSLDSLADLGVGVNDPVSVFLDDQLIGTLSVGEVESLSILESSLNSLTGNNLRLEVADLLGNQSIIEIPMIEVAEDITPPVVTEVAQNRIFSLDGIDYSPPVGAPEGYIFQNDEVDWIDISISESETDIVGFRYALVAHDATVSESDWSEIFISIPDSASRRNLHITDRKYDIGSSIINGEDYRLVIQSQNQVGLLSIPVYSGLLNAALSEPTLDVDQAQSGVGAENGEIVSNGNESLVFSIAPDSIDSNTSELIHSMPFAYVEWAIFSPLDEILNSGQAILSDNEEMVIPFQLGAEPDAGYYSFVSDVTGPTGLRNSYLLPIRLNTGPVLAIDTLYTSPAREVSLLGRYDVDDDDPIQDWTASLYLGDTLQQSWTNINPESWTFSVEHIAAGNQESIYRLVIDATDIYGMTGSGETEVVVRNTSAGILQADEHWSGTHRLTGPVIVPDGITLTISDGISILAVVDETTSETPALIIESGASIVHQGNAEYRLENQASDKLWDGLEIHSNTDLNNISVSGATRGIALVGSMSPSIAELTLSDNLIGLHLFEASPYVSDCTFEDNIHYGVKEDQNALPVMVDNVFIDNGYDYYHEGGILLDAEGINNLSIANERNQ